MSLFKSWMASQGFNGKQVSEAGAALGMRSQTAGIRYRGEKDPDMIERLAMAAVAARLPAWSLESDREIRALPAGDWGGQGGDWPAENE